jgi:hypothetical protein
MVSASVVNPQLCRHNIAQHQQQTYSASATGDVNVSPKSTPAHTQRCCLHQQQQFVKFQIPTLTTLASTTSATLATSTSLATNETTPISSQPSAAANACACSAVSAQLQNQPQRSISIQLSAQQFGS